MADLPGRHSVGVARDGWSTVSAIRTGVSGAVLDRLGASDSVCHRTDADFVRGQYAYSGTRTPADCRIHVGIIMDGISHPPAASSIKATYKRRRQPVPNDRAEHLANIDGLQDAKRPNLGGTLHLRPRSAVERA